MATPRPQLAPAWVPAGARCSELCAVELPRHGKQVSWTEYQCLLAKRLTRLIAAYPNVREAERDIERKFWDRLGREFYHDRVKTPWELADQVVQSWDVLPLLQLNGDLDSSLFPTKPVPDEDVADVMACTTLSDWLVYLLPSRE